MKLFLIASGLFCSTLVLAEAAIPVYEINSKETFIQAPLDQEIYLYSQDSELSDLQVQDAQGNILPFRVMDISAESLTLNRETPAVFFPVAANTSEETLRTLSSTSININTDKVQVEIKESAANPELTIEQPDFYLVDLTAFQKKSAQSSALKLNALRLNSSANPIDNKGVTSYQIWELSVSNDLHNWNLISTTSLVNLQKEGHSLVQDKIPLNIDYQDYAYLKLRCIESCSNVQLSQIYIIEESTEQFFPADTQWQLKGKPSSEKAIKLEMNDSWQTSAAWNFVRNDVAPIEKFSINLGTQSYGDKIRLLGRTRKQDAWELLYQGIWFNTKVGSQWYVSSPQALYGHNYREFRLELVGQLQPDTNPELVFYTQSRFIQFIANETPPYKLLVVESANSEGQARILDSLLNNQSPDWINHQWTFLNPPKPENVRSISWRSLMFWGLLILAVALLALMAIKLFKQMNTKAE
jgi:Protein of unknown function (DUF3999)